MQAPRGPGGLHPDDSRPPVPRPADALLGPAQSGGGSRYPPCRRLTLAEPAWPLARAAYAERPSHTSLVRGPPARAVHEGLQGHQGPAATRGAPVGVHEHGITIQTQVGPVEMDPAMVESTFVHYFSHVNPLPSLSPPPAADLAPRGATAPTTFVAGSVIEPRPNTLDKSGHSRA